MATLIDEGRASLLSFLSGTFVLALPLICSLFHELQKVWFHFYIFLVAIYVLFQNLALWRFYHHRPKLYQVAVRGGFLGSACGVGIIISLSDLTIIHFGWYCVALSFFHWSEYFVTAVTNPRSLSLESYLLDHSREYKMAAVGSWLEFFIEWYLFPGMKQFRYVSLFGLMLVLGGEIVRKASMFTAKSNFNHYVQYMKQKGHTLVTTGVYSWCRHPAYFGWFYWSLGTQIILCNPVCFVAYLVASWRFFNERIFEEEIYLLSFFGEDYYNYQKMVGTGLPFIKGFKGEPSK